MRTAPTLSLVFAHPDRSVFVYSTNDLTFGKTLGAGAFGTVRQATALLDGVTTKVAVKTLTFTEQDDFEEKLEEFTQEATVGWAISARSRNGVRHTFSRPCFSNTPLVTVQQAERYAAFAERVAAVRDHRSRTRLVQGACQLALDT